MGRVAVALLVDTGPLFAYLDADDRHHAACSALLEGHPGPLLAPQLVIAEVAYFAATRLGPHVEVRFLEDLAAGTFVASPVEPSDWLRIAELVWAYRSMDLGTVDASAVALAERAGISEIATLDRRHFGAVRPAHVDVFQLLPAPEGV